MVVLQKYTIEEVQTHNKTEDAWMVIDDWVLDVTHFFSIHPGGPEILEPHLGKDATVIFRDPSIHIHGQSAQRLLRKFLIGYIAGKKTPEEVKLAGESRKTAADYGINVDKGLLQQVASLDSKKYEEFIHEVLVLNGPSLRFFDFGILEIFTRSPWYTVPIVWIPIVFLLFYFACSYGLPLWLLPFFLFLAPLVWNFFEYQLHRHLFHMEPTTLAMQLIHFLLHGYHHICPGDRLRLTFPPIPAMLIATLLYYSTGIFLLPHSLGLATMGTICGGYIYYDLMHYYLHHAPAKFLYAKALKKHHLYHHYKNEEANFGISMWVFDYLFDTYDATMIQEKRKQEIKQKTQ